LGQKVHPTGFRLGVVKGWQSRWYAERDYKDVYAEDVLIRQAINKELFNAAVSRIEIERAAANQVSVTIHTAKPGIVIGKSGEKVDRLRAMLEAKTKKRVRLNIMEIRQPELDAYLVGRSVAEQLEKRVSFRRAMKQAVQKSMRANAKGIKIICGGRLGGAEIARSEKEVEGKIPLHTLRADIDYGLAEAHTTFGVIGIKVWIYKGDILPSKRREAFEGQQETVQPPFAPREREGGDRRGGDRRRGGESGQRADRGPRPQGDRPQGGDRRDSGPRQTGDRPPRPQGERPARPQGDRTARPQGQGGERTPRQPRPQGESAARPARTQAEHAPRPQAEQPATAQLVQGEQAEQAPVVQSVVTEQTPVVQSVQAEQTPVVQPVQAEQAPAVQETPEVTPPTPEAGTAQSE
jgi:small subunit ribosomal protein S3